jgi:hypothetical protein
MNDLIKLVSRAGSYLGDGKNHEGQPFKGSLEISNLLSGRGVLFVFRATGLDGTFFHEEFSTIAPSMGGELMLFNLNTNAPGMVAHRLARSVNSREEIALMVFLHGDLSNGHTFREEITIELHSNGSIGYKYAWGMPGGEFADRSSVVMKKI